MGTFAQLKAEIAVDLTRSDLTTQVNQAVLDAVADHGQERFWFNETRSYSLSLVDGTSEYSISSSAPVLDFIHIDWIRLRSGSTDLGRLTRIDGDEMEELHQTTTEGEPAWWAYYENELKFFPTPGASYTARIAGHYRLIELSADGDSNAWTNAGRMLIRYCALKKLFAFPPKDPDKALVAASFEKDQLDILRRETDRRKRSGRMRPYY